MGVVRVKDGVLFSVISPGGFRLLSAINGAAVTLNHDITITAACDGLHSGPDDPHHKGNAYDVRTHDVPDKEALLREIMNRLDAGRFFGFIEDPDTDNEHIHCQVKKGTIFP